MAIEVFKGNAIPRDLATAGLEYVWTKWRTLNDTGALTLHRLIDESNPPLHDRCCYLMPDGDDFAYIYVGREMQDAIRRGPTTSLLARDDSPVVRDLAEAYRRVLREMSPAFIRFTSPLSAPGTIWHQIIMPVRISPGAAIVACYSELISHQNEVYEQLFRTAPSAMAVACPICNDAGLVTDGWVLMMNDRARDILDFHGPVGNLRLSALRQFDGIDLWGRIHAPRGSATVVQAPQFDIEILRFPNVFGLRLTPRTVAVAAGQVPLAPEQGTAQPVHSGE
jgi:hypothetical protein